MKIILLCPWNVETGGPEAIHQLSNELIELGFDASIFYTIDSDFDTISNLKSNSIVTSISIPLRANIIDAYKHYKVNLITELHFNSDSLFVLPETYLSWVHIFDNNKLIIWWLSVDNAFAQMDMKKINLNLLKSNRIKHCYQSKYAFSFLQALNFKNTYPLSDWTNTDILPTVFSKKYISISALPHKVHLNIDFYVNEIQNFCNVEVIPLRSFSREQIYAIFNDSYIYIDFGNFPGKDRMPREALVRDCCLLTSDSGAAGHNEFNISREYIIDCRYPELIKHYCRHILQNYKENLTSLKESKLSIHNERLIFKSEIFNIFNSY